MVIWDERTNYTLFVSELNGLYIMANRFEHLVCLQIEANVLV